MKDMEKQVTKNSMDALPPVQVMAGGEEQDPLILVDRRINPVSINCTTLLPKKKNTLLSPPPLPPSLSHLRFDRSCIRNKYIVVGEMYGWIYMPKPIACIFSPRIPPRSSSLINFNRGVA